MYTSLHVSNDKTRAIMLRSNHSRKKARIKPTQPTKRSESTYSSKSYRDGLQRAFNNAKMQIFFNPDMQNFITLTYKGKDHTLESVMHDIKMLVKRENRLADRAQRGELKYIWVAEYQKRGSIHIHMIANNSFTLQVNQNGYNELKYWQKGFSSVLHINDMDSNFRPYLYLFKYMRKAQRIGKSFLHSSRNLKNYTDESHVQLNLAHWRTLTQEHTTTSLPNTPTKNLHYFRNFLERDTIPTQQHNQGTKSWLDKAKLPYTKVHLKQRNHLQHLGSKLDHGTHYTSHSQNSKWNISQNTSKVVIHQQVKQNQAKLF